MAHSHDLGSHTHTGPSHTHSTPAHTHTGTTDIFDNTGSDTQLGNGTAGIRKDHKHTFTTASGGASTTGSSGTGNTGAAVGNTGTYSSDTGSTSNEPQHVTVLFCKKD